MVSQPSPIFVGRQREIAGLTAALDSSIAGHGGLAMLVGEPGIGKTRTALELASYAEGRGAQVLWGRCYEEEGAPPYWPWVQATVITCNWRNRTGFGPRWVPEQPTSR